jgi:acetyl esterase/lipase
MKRYVAALIVCFCLAPFLAAAQEELPYDRTVDHVYATIDGQDFFMDVFVPNRTNRLEYYQPNDNGFGLGIIDVASGAWSADRGKLKDHETAQVYNIMTARGYTVFAVRPGSRPEFTVPDMVDRVKAGIRYVKANAADWNVDPERLGLMGASAGGHLALLTALTADPPRTDADDPLLKAGTGVKAVGVFFPPTDFVEWEGMSYSSKLERVGDLLFRDLEDRSKEEILSRLQEISPIHRIPKGELPPFLFFHGTADPLVPLSQSQKMVDALKEKNFDATLVIKPGGGHPWLDIPLDVIKMADWFDHHLMGAPAPELEAAGAKATE